MAERESDTKKRSSILSEEEKVDPSNTPGQSLRSRRRTSSAPPNRNDPLRFSEYRTAPKLQVISQSQFQTENELIIASQTTTKGDETEDEMMIVSQTTNTLTRSPTGSQRSASSQSSQESGSKRVSQSSKSSSGRSSQRSSIASRTSDTDPDADPERFSFMCGQLTSSTSLANLALQFPDSFFTYLREKPDYVRQLEDDFECLQRVFLSLVTRFAHVQFCLHTTLETPHEDERALFLDHLERYAHEKYCDDYEFQRAITNRAYNKNRYINEDVRRQYYMIEKVRSKLATLDEFQFAIAPLEEFLKPSISVEPEKPEFFDADDGLAVVVTDKPSESIQSQWSQR